MVQQAILVVDDEAPMRKFVSHNLKAGGYNVLTASDGSEALKLASENALDLLLLDIGLPGPDGLAVLQAVRRDYEVPVLMISARGREADRVRALDLGADDYLTKPFGVAELLARVRALLRRVSGTSFPSRRSGAPNTATKRTTSGPSSSAYVANWSPTAIIPSIS
jgi:two-component system KDP operon response regulator KdpE